MPGLFSPRSSYWKWWVCGLLLLATTINYMDRMALSVMSPEIMTALRIDEQGYGYLESAFGTAFALGAILSGWLSDRVNVRWLYPVVVCVWSVAGVATGLVHGFVAFLMCRFLLGLAESGNWPCALQTTKQILKPEQRTMGNGILQSGAAIGAVLTPPTVLALIAWTGNWKVPFVVIGVIGGLWIVLWLLTVRTRDLSTPQGPATSSMIGILVGLVLIQLLDLAVHLLFADETLFGWSAPLVCKLGFTILCIVLVSRWIFDATRHELTDRSTFLRRFWVLAVIVVVINITWHFFRAWMPLFLVNQHKYTPDQSKWFSMAYYLASDLGSLTVGWATLSFVRGGWSVHGSRTVVYAICALLTTLSIAVALLPAGPILLGLLLVIGFACLAMFPIYYSLSQEITLSHQGKVTGALGCICWFSMSLLHEVIGDSVKRSGSYSDGVALVGMLPLLGLLALVLFWNRSVRVTRTVGVHAQPNRRKLSRPVKH